jgi:hypothetical protein
MMGNDTNGTYRPASNITREEAATILYRLIDYNARAKNRVYGQKPSTKPTTHPESGTPIPGTTTPWEGTYTRTFNPLQGPASIRELGTLYCYDAEPNNPYNPLVYTREGGIHPTKYPLYQEGMHQEVVLGDRVGMYINGYLIYLGMSEDDLVKALGEPTKKSEPWGVNALSSVSLWTMDGGYVISMGSTPEGKWYVNQSKMQWGLGKTEERKDLWNRTDQRRTLAR